MSQALELAFPSTSPHVAIDALAIEALTRELVCYPKPGLVSLVDSGSHNDMDAATFRSSIAALEGYFGRMAEEGAAGAPFRELNRIGRAAEARMFAATGGVNTHRGAVFSLGLLAAAAGFAMTRGETAAVAVCRIVAELWGPGILAAGGSSKDRSHGAEVRARYGAPGAREEAAAGFPTVIGHALPAYRAARGSGADDNDAMVQAFFAIVASLDDNNLLYRGGLSALRQAQDLALDFLGAGGVLAPGGLDRAVSIHRLFVARRLSPGGGADLLAATVFLERFEARETTPCR